MTRRLANVLLATGAALALAAASGCHTPVGNYFANRARDFGECWRAEAGPGYGFGVGVRGAGIIDVGLGGAVGSVGGWTYGAATTGDGLNDVELWFPFSLAKPNSRPFAHVDARHRREHACWLVLPGLFGMASDWSRTPVRPRWIWTMPGDHGAWARVHAFDVELSLTLFVGRVHLGFSPGEFLDFLLGWFGLDLAGDDRAWEPPPE